MRLLPFVSLALLALPATALAQESVDDKAPAAPPVITTPAPTAATDDWNARFAAARDRLVAGDFEACAAAFDGLIATAPSEALRAVAIDEADLCHTFSKRGYTFVKKSDLGESSISAKARGERTTDELAVLYTNAVLFGVGTGGWLAVQTEPQSAAGVILPMLGFAGAFAGGVALADSGKPLKYGLPQSIVAGMYVGLMEGLTWTLWNQAKSTYRDEWTGKTVATLIWGSAGVGAIAGGVIGANFATTPGRASYVESTALWTGLVMGLLGSAFSAKNDMQDDHALLASAIGVNAGALLGVFTAKDMSPSIARVRFLDLGGIGGALVFGGLYLAAANNDADGRALAGTTAVGIATGLLVAGIATHGMTPDRIEADQAKTNGSSVATFLRTLSPNLTPTKGGGTVGLSAIW